MACQSQISGKKKEEISLIHHSAEFAKRVVKLKFISHGSSPPIFAVANLLLWHFAIVL